MIALLSCALISLSLTFVDSEADGMHENPMERKFITRSSTIFILDLFCLVWAMGEMILRIITSPSLYRYLTTLGFFDLVGKKRCDRNSLYLSHIGVLFHLIYICIISMRSELRFVKVLEKKKFH